MTEVARPALAAAAAVAAATAAAGILGLDAIVAQHSAAVLPIEPGLSTIVGALDFVALKGISTYLLGFLLILLAVALIRLKQRGGWPLLYVALVLFLSTTVADLSKPQLGRLRPYEAFPNGLGLDQWFAGGQSFPSGHTAFYFGLFLPLIMLWPRYTLLWLVIPLLVATQRVMAHDHYLSDVAASVSLAALLAAALSGIARKA